MMVRCLMSVHTTYIFIIILFLQAKRFHATYVLVHTSETECLFLYMLKKTIFFILLVLNNRLHDIPILSLQFSNVYMRHFIALFKVINIYSKLMS